jgi:hypothetical protein
MVSSKTTLFNAAGDLLLVIKSLIMEAKVGYTELDNGLMKEFINNISYSDILVNIKNA